MRLRKADRRPAGAGQWSVVGVVPGFSAKFGVCVGSTAEVVGVARVTGDEVIIAATAEAHGMLCKVDEVNFLSGPGKGVILIKLASDDDRVLGFIASSGDRDLLTVETSRGAEQTISTAKYDVTGRGGKGRELLQRGQFTRVIWPTPAAPPPLSAS